MTSHTPGPWLYRPHKHDDWGFVRAPAIDGQPGPLVACARSGRYHCDEEFNEHRRNRTDPYEANARLIAAAPDLFAVLQRYMAAYPAFRIKPIGAPGSEKRIEQENLMALEEAAQAVTARVMGREQA